jgi:hypothetical protein
LSRVRGNLASTVLRGRGGGNAAPLPDEELGAQVRKGEKGSLIVKYGLCGRPHKP